MHAAHAATAIAHNARIREICHQTMMHVPFSKMLFSLRLHLCKGSQSSSLLHSNVVLPNPCPEIPRLCVGNDEPIRIIVLGSY